MAPAVRQDIVVMLLDDAPRALLVKTLPGESQAPLLPSSPHITFGERGMSALP